MRYVSLFVLAIFGNTLYSVDQLEFIDFELVQKGETIELTVHPKGLMPYREIKDPQFGIAREMIEYSLDAPMRQIAFMLRTLASNKAVLLGKSTSKLDILSIPLHLRIRQLNGNIIQEKKYFVAVGISQKGAYLTYEKNEFFVDPTKLNVPEDYNAFLTRLIFPFERYDVTPPKDTAFVVDLHFRWPKLLVKDSDKPVFDLFPSAILWNKGPITKIDMFLGSAYVAKTAKGNWQIESGNVLKSYAQTQARLREAIMLSPEDQPTLEQVGIYEEILHQFPMNRKVLERLMNAYLYHEMEDEAASLIRGRQPIFSTIRKGLEHQSDLANRADRKRNFLLGRKQFFKKSPMAEVKITSPEVNDLITGLSELVFSIENAESPILAAYCYFDDELIGQLQKEPWRIRFSSGRKRAVLPIKVTVYFEDETFAEQQIDIRTMPVDQELSVNLVPLRVVVSKGGTGFLTNLKAEDFDIKENGVSQAVAHFSSENAPLRIAVLLDTSISMTGEKLDRAQYALYRFISNLEKEDRVSLYTFDHKVLRLNDFTNDFKSLTPLIFNTCPQLTTTLNDACLAGIQSLEDQNGTRILLILSDGTDSASVSLDKHVVNALARSDVMVYSIVLPGNWAGQSNAQGNMFLKDLAKMTGSVSTRLVRVKGVDQALKKISDEFRSFYYIGYYSKIPHGQRRELDIDVKGFRAKVRYRVLQP